MTGQQTITRPGTSQDESPDSGAWLEQVAASLAIAGLRCQVTETAGEACLTITASRPGCRETEVIVDGDGYCELRWWLPRTATPTTAFAVITAALRAVRPPAARP
jgi:hypothetical protein